MPLIKSAKKQNRQNLKHRLRNYRVRHELKVTIQEMEDVANGGKKEDAEVLLKKAYKVIDTAAKKNIIHPNNAARKKSQMAKLIVDMGKEKAEAPTKKKAKAKTDKKAEVAEAPKKEEAAE